jgi:hypothetical protein
MSCHVVSQLCLQPIQVPGAWDKQSVAGDIIQQGTRMLTGWTACFPALHHSQTGLTYHTHKNSTQAVIHTRAIHAPHQASAALTALRPLPKPHLAAPHAAPSSADCRAGCCNMWWHRSNPSRLTRVKPLPSVHKTQDDSQRLTVQGHSNGRMACVHMCITWLQCRMPHFCCITVCTTLLLHLLFAPAPLLTTAGDHSSLQTAASPHHLPQGP